MSNFLDWLMRVATHPLFKYYVHIFGLVQVALMLLCWKLTGPGNGLVLIALTTAALGATACGVHKLADEDGAFLFIIVLPLFTLIVFAVMCLVPAFGR